MSEPLEANQDAAAAIAQSIDGYLEQLTNSRDLEAAADFYTPDAKLIGPDTDMGRSDLVETLHSVFENGIEVDVNRRTVELFVHGDAAYEIAQTDDTLVNPDGSSQTLRNNLFIRWERGADGKWRFARVLLSPQTLG